MGSIFIMSQASTNTAMTTTTLVTVVCTSTSSLLSTVTIPPLMGLPTMSGQHDVVVLPLLTPRHSEGVVGLALFNRSNLHLRCLFRLMSIMPWVLHR